MFISTLKRLIEGYDLYGEHRLNTLKSLFILTLLEAVNLIYGIQNPYFNYFYVPFTALTLEMTAETLRDKYVNFFHAVAGSIIAIFLFDILVVYPLLFVFFVLIYSLVHYIVALHFIKGIFVPIPIALSLAAYSLTYGEINTDWYIALNNSLITIVAFLICIAGLVCFPRSYYYRSWLRAYIFLLKQITDNFIAAENHQPVPVIVQGHLVKIVKYANLLPKKMPTYSVLKINLLINDLRVLSCVLDQNEIKLEPRELRSLIEHLQYFIKAVESELPYNSVTYPNKTIKKMAESWNYLCSKI